MTPQVRFGSVTLRRLRSIAYKRGLIKANKRHYTRLAMTWQEKENLWPTKCGKSFRGPAFHQLPAYGSLVFTSFYFIFFFLTKESCFSFQNLTWLPLDGFFLTSPARNYQVNRRPSTCISNLSANKFSEIFKQSAIHLILPSIINCGIYYCLYLPSFPFDGCLFQGGKVSLSLSLQRCESSSQTKKGQ